MKKLFLAIRHGELKLVKDIITKKPELVNCVGKQPPKKDHGQSPLQVSLKCGQFLIADFLIDSGANVNFIEAEGCNDWQMPVVQDAIMAAINCSRWLKCSYQRNSSGELIEVYDTFAHTEEETEMSFAILKKLFEKGADINCADSYGNSCLQRAILDARQFLPRNTEKNPRPINKELIEDFTRIFQLLFF